MVAVAKGLGFLRTLGAIPLWAATLAFLLVLVAPIGQLPTADFYSVSAQVLPAYLVALAVESLTGARWQAGEHLLTYRLQTLACIAVGEIGAMVALSRSAGTGENGSAFLAGLTVAGLVGSSVAFALLILRDRPWLGKKPELQPIPCAAEGALFAERSHERAEIEFENRRSSDVHVVWLDFEGHRHPDHVSRVPAQKSIVIHTLLGHPWLALDSNDDCLGIYLPQPNPTHVTLEDVQVTRPAES